MHTHIIYNFFHININGAAGSQNIICTQWFSGPSSNGIPRVYAYTQRVQIRGFREGKISYRILLFLLKMIIIIKWKMKEKNLIKYHDCGKKIPVHAAKTRRVCQEIMAKPKIGLAAAAAAGAPAPEKTAAVPIMYRYFRIFHSKIRADHGTPFPWKSICHIQSTGIWKGRVYILRTTMVNIYFYI